MMLGDEKMRGSCDIFIIVVGYALFCGQPSTCATPPFPAFSLPFPFPLCGLVTTRAADKVTKLLVGIYNAPVLVAGVWLCGGVFEWVVF